MKIGVACDHAGFEYKEKLKELLSSKTHEVNDFGCFSLESVDYPDFAHKLAESIEKGENNLGIQFCGTGNGINMSANKHQGIRAALCWTEEIAQLARQHNDANIVSLPARFIETEKAKKIIEAFLKTDFEGGRHERRVSKISC